MFLHATRTRKAGTVATLLTALTVSLGMTAPVVHSAGASHPANAGIRPANFVRSIDNPYMPLKPGTTFIYRGKRDGKPERNVVRVTHQTKLISGVTAVVVHDQVFVRGHLAEDTYDWYAQDKAGNVWYLGENSKDVKNGRVTSVAGSWEAGKRGAQPGIIMQAHPHVGMAYRQEFLKGEAEDRARVVALNRSVAVPYGSFKGLLVTKEWTALEPGVVENKYYARNLGNVCTTTVKGGSDYDELIGVRHG